MAESNYSVQGQDYLYPLEDNSNDVKDMVLVTKQSWMKLCKIEFYEKLNYLYKGISPLNMSTAGQMSAQLPHLFYPQQQQYREERFPKFEAAVEAFFTPRHFTDKRHQDLINTIDYQKRVVSKMSELKSNFSMYTNTNAFILAAVWIEIEAIIHINSL